MKSIILIAVTVACLTGCLRDSNRFIPWVMLLDMEVYLDDKLVLHNSFQVAENTRAPFFWNCSGDLPDYCDKKLNKIKPDKVNPLQATLSGKVVIKIFRARSLMTEAKLDGLTLKRENADSIKWHLTQNEVERAKKAAVYQTHAEESKKRKLPACDPVATAKWLTSLYTLQEGKLTFCAEDTDRLIGQIPIAAKAKVSSDGDGMTIDQEGLLPVQYSDRAGYRSFFFIHPLKSRYFSDDFVPYGKDVAVEEDSSKFRTLGQALYTYFTGLALQKPDHHRVEDVFGYPSDHYIWEVGGSTVFLKAYQGNDSHGLMLRVCSQETDPGRAEIARQQSRIAGAKISAKKEVFEGWGEPLLQITKE